MNDSYYHDVAYGETRLPHRASAKIEGLAGAAINEIEREIDAAKRSSTTYNSARRGSWHGPFADDLDPYQLNNESLKNFLILQGV